MLVSAHMFCMHVVCIYIVHIRTHRGLCKNCVFFVHAWKIRNIFNMLMEHNVNLAYCDTRHTFVVCVWSPLVASNT